MSFDKKLNGKILDPIHGTIMITDIERKVIGHRLFQRLRTVKQNTFLYKVFPSAMHSRFEHSLGVMNVAYQMFDNMLINSYRYIDKYDDSNVFSCLDKIKDTHVQELRLAALLHDVGHGPMSHQFDSFLMTKTQLKSVLGESFQDVYTLIETDDSVEHEHISVVFIRKILNDLNLENLVNVDNVIKFIEQKYKDGKVEVNIDDNIYDIQPLFSSLISSSPIDSDRMDYLLRDSYFSGVKCGLYNIERLLNSIVPVLEDGKIFIAYKESCLDSISEFVFSRTNLFSQVYYHKTNRALSAMLSKVCDLAVSDGKENIISKLYGLEDGLDKYNLSKLQEFYLDNSDDEFINETVPELVQHNDLAAKIINDIVDRKPWKKVYESKYYSGATITSKADKELIDDIKGSLTSELLKALNKDDFIIDIVTDNAFKDIDKSTIKLLIKDSLGVYHPKNISECEDRLNMYQTIRYFVRVFINPDLKDINKVTLGDSLSTVYKDKIFTYERKKEK
ncbi:HD domain-containing protein [Vibrio vulnificus]